MAMTFKTNLLPDQNLVRELGSSTQKWKINGVTDPKLTDTVTTVTTSGSGNAITAISASNGAITATKGTTFLTSHQDISGKVNKSGDTMTGTLSAPRVYGTQTAGEGQVGVSYNGGKLYLWGNNTSGSAGLYDSNGTYILERDSGTNKYKIYGDQLIIDTGTNPDGNTQGHGVRIWHDIEGGNIGIYAGKNGNQTNNYFYEMDAYNGNLRIVAKKNGKYLSTPCQFLVPSEDDTLGLFTLRVTGEVQSTSANAFRLVQGNYGVILRNDGSSFWILPTASGDPYGSWNQGAVKVRVLLSNGALYGAVWNDYAEFRKNNEKEKDVQQPGRCIKENGDGTLSLTTQRLERGCEIISDTYGFAIGQDEENGYNTPIASNGRVLAYPYESIEEFTNHIGWPVCSGPNGTVSIMTEEEEEKYPSRIIGTISEIPSYEEWGTGKVKVNGRIWIRIK